MKDPLGVSPSKGNLGTTRGKEKILLTSVGIEPTSTVTLPTEQRGSIVANPIIYRLVPSPSRYEIRQYIWKAAVEFLVTKWNNYFAS